MDVRTIEKCLLLLAIGLVCLLLELFIVRRRPIPITRQHAIQQISGADATCNPQLIKKISSIKAKQMLNRKVESFGLYTNTRINKGSIFSQQSICDEPLMNDGLVNLHPINKAYLAGNTNKFYKALCGLYDNYRYDKRRINCILVQDFGAGRYDPYFYRAIRDIKPGEELFRAYGLWYWLDMLWGSMRHGEHRLFAQSFADFFKYKDVMINNFGPTSYLIGEVDFYCRLTKNDGKPMPPKLPGHGRL